MRHNKKFNHLSRTSSHRKALLANMSNALIFKKRIFTTLAKAKSLRKHVEPIITRSKKDTGHNRRLIFSYLKNPSAVTELFETVAEKVADRAGGYTRIIRTNYRKGDNAEMCMMELVDFNDLYVQTKVVQTKRSRRSRRGGKNIAAENLEVATSEGQNLQENDNKQDEDKNLKTE